VRRASKTRHLGLHGSIGRAPNVRLQYKTKDMRGSREMLPKEYDHGVVPAPHAAHSRWGLLGTGHRTSSNNSDGLPRGRKALAQGGGCR